MAGEAEKRMRLAADVGIFQSPDLLRVIFEQVARDAHVIKYGPSSVNAEHSLRLDGTASRDFLRLSGTIELVCRRWRDSMREPSLWKALLKTRSPAMSKYADSASDPRAMYARLRGLRLMTTIYDVTLLLEIHDKKGIVVQRAFPLREARKAESFCGHQPHALVLSCPELNDARIRGKRLIAYDGFEMLVTLLRADGKIVNPRLAGYTELFGFGDSAHTHYSTNLRPLPLLARRVLHQQDSSVPGIVCTLSVSFARQEISFHLEYMHEKFMLDGETDEMEEGVEDLLDDVNLDTGNVGTEPLLDEIGWE